MRGFGDLEAAIMTSLWSRAEPATVREVLQDLSAQRNPAYTTIMTVMTILHRKGWLHREMDGRAWRYAPVLTREEYAARLMREALDEGVDRAAVLARFVETVSEEESEALRRRVEGRERRDGGRLESDGHRRGGRGGHERRSAQPGWRSDVAGSLAAPRDECGHLLRGRGHDVRRRAAGRAGLPVRLDRCGSHVGADELTGFARSGADDRPVIAMGPMRDLAPTFAGGGMPERYPATSAVDRSPVLRDLDLRLTAGTVVGIRGANGAGKTTLLQLAATVRRPVSGIARVLGADLRNAPPPEVRRAICLVGHDPGLYPQLSLRENLRFVADIHGSRPTTVETALRHVGLARAADRRVDRCSQGMVKRADLARALISRPTLLLLDEPHAGLDATATELVDFLLADVRERGGAALVVSHDRDRLQAMVDDVLELRDGRLLPLEGPG